MKLKLQGIGKGAIKIDETSLSAGEKDIFEFKEEE
jgi:hypothetical protein